ncbi:PucR family transcriptional regulator [Actinosynnema mirum]|uniref:Transcriptional regulator, CdaR n=1 Tax=Actinosynnema mirum (strain ATCC 29888 / DSM 43827 / JCM 3225 / NBRC 14064 / NCIMB 13271 / NRRL B-12336 / IMRU 3971 / 101) TaxID=446462 RepID=C6WQR2_ACTMD|nr:helix-turn-helix domain-containing protein [Actinosynnema mirum]ACU38752.1 transcriptional regulator, CdaR [Actinosynnema mirum DSM 43827]
MTGDKAPPRIAGRAVAPALRAGASALAARVVERLTAELPVYADLPREEVAGDITAIVRHNLLVCADVLERRGPATEVELRPQRESAELRAEEGVPLEAVLSAYQLGASLCCRALIEDAGPDDLPTVLEVVEGLLGFQRQLTAEVTRAYQRAALDGRSGRHALLAALLAGEGPEAPGGYLALELLLPPHRDESGAGARISARRKLRRVLAVLDGFADEPALTALDHAGGTALLPLAAEPAWPAVRALVERLARAADVPVTAAAGYAGAPGVPAAVARNAEVLEVVLRTDRGPGAHRLADVLLDYQLSRPSGALLPLAGLVAALEPRPELLRTLEVHLALDLDRRATAARLHLHPNTVDYRLRRIHRLTGLSPTRPQDCRSLAAALVARRFTGDPRP